MPQFTRPPWIHENGSFPNSFISIDKGTYGDPHDFASRLISGESSLGYFGWLMGNTFPYFEEVEAALNDLIGAERPSLTRLLFDSALKLFYSGNIIGGLWILHCLRNRGSEWHPFEWKEEWFDELDPISVGMKDTLDLVGLLSTAPNCAQRPLLHYVGTPHYLG